MVHVKSFASAAAASLRVIGVVNQRLNSSLYTKIFHSQLNFNLIQFYFSVCAHNVICSSRSGLIAAVRDTKQLCLPAGFVFNYLRASSSDIDLTISLSQLSFTFRQFAFIRILDSSRET